MFSRWWCDIGSEPYGVMSLEGESSKEEVDFFLRLWRPNDIPYHVRCINHRDREEHTSRQG